MYPNYDDPAISMDMSLKIDLIGRWIESEWIVSRPGQEWEIIWAAYFCAEEGIVSGFDREFALPDGFQFAGHRTTACPHIVRIASYTFLGEPRHRSGAYVYRFAKPETGEEVEVLLAATYFSDDGRVACLVCRPKSFARVWGAFAQECERLAKALQPQQRVVIVGGRSTSFVPTIEWDDVVLPDDLKADLLEDVEAFYAKGIGVYKRLNLKPFRKLLLAGVPGTGKTMLCSALANWALKRKYVAIYISSGDMHGATFAKIEHALSVAANSGYPTLIILEELDAYLQRKDEKSLILNVLDGVESNVNNEGTLLIATTNYPDAIDERVLKRPGRLDRIFIIPEIRRAEEAEKMLRRYLRDLWQDDHQEVVKQLVGYSGAFVREVAVYALTQVAYSDLPNLPLDLLQKSLDSLKSQIDTRDDFLMQQTKSKPFGLGQHIPQPGNGR